PAASSPAASSPAAGASAAAASSSVSAGVSAAPGSAAVSAAPGTQLVRVGALQIVSDAGLYIARDKGYFRDAGLTVEIVNFSNLGEQIALLATGKLDVGGGGVDAGLFNGVSRGVPLKIVADKGSNLSPQFSSQALVVRKDLMDAGKVKSYKDLKGLNIGMSQLQNSVEELVARALESDGLTIKDVTPKILPFPEMNTAMANKSIDAAVQLEPLLTVGVKQGLFVSWKTAYEIYPDQQVAVLLYSPDFAGRRDVAQKFTTAYVHAVRDYNDAFRHQKEYDQVVDILAKGTTLKDKSLYSQVRLSGLNPDGHVNAQGLADDLAWYRKNGYVKGDLTLNQVIDDSFVTQADKELGPYSG
ncbi:MAG TPA: ABC transporter substrate-binding protein, partial [Chloroflexota bacterium]